MVNGLDLDSHSVDWNVHMHLMLHITFLGLDNNHPVVHQHCKQERSELISSLISSINKKALLSIWPWF